MPTYLVERYWPGVTSELLLEALDRGRTVKEQMIAGGTLVRDIISVLIPAEEVVFSLYEGPSAEAVLQLNERAGIQVSRIVEATWVSGDCADRLGRPAGRRWRTATACVYPDGRVGYGAGEPRSVRRNDSLRPNVTS